MSEEIDDGGPAFPIVFKDGERGYVVVDIVPATEADPTIVVDGTKIQADCLAVARRAPASTTDAYAAIETDRPTVAENPKKLQDRQAAVLDQIKALCKAYNNAQQPGQGRAIVELHPYECRCTVCWYKYDGPSRNHLPFQSLSAQILGELANDQQ
jgi:hypothetical protein